MELKLPSDPSKKKSGTIINEDIIKRCWLCHLFLQSTRIKVKFHKPYPYSIFIFKLQEYKEKRLNFDFQDNVPLFTIAIRMGDIGVIACLQDNNTQETLFKNEIRKIKRIKLHPK